MSTSKRGNGIHHNTKAKANKAGFEIFADGEEFGLQQIEDGAEMDGRWSSAAEAAQAATNHADPDHDDELEAKEEEAADEAGDEATDEVEAEDTRSKSGVMPLDYHKQYTANGGGCGDILDQKLRDAFMSVDGLKRDEFIAFVKEHSLWRPRWEGLNPGMIRMNAANVIRAKLRNDPEFILTIPGEVPGRFGVEHKPRKARVRKGAKAQADKEMAEAIADATPSTDTPEAPAPEAETPNQG